LLKRLRTEARRATRQIKQTLTGFLIGLTLAAILWPIIAKAFAEKETPLIHSSDSTGLALVSTRDIFSESATASKRFYSRDTPDTSGVRAYTYPYKAQNGAVSNLNTTDATMLAYIKHKESSGNPNAQNPTSSAFGLYGFLNSTWATVGCVKTSDPVEQERCALLYIEQRYGSIAGAYHFHRQHNWY